MALTQSGWPFWPERFNKGEILLLALKIRGMGASGEAHGSSQELRAAPAASQQDMGTLAPAGAAQWTEHRSANCKVAGWIPRRGARLGCRPGSQLGVHGRQLIDVSLTR